MDESKFNNVFKLYCTFFTAEDKQHLQNNLTKFYLAFNLVMTITHTILILDLK